VLDPEDPVIARAGAGRVHDDVELHAPAASIVRDRGIPVELARDRLRAVDGVVRRLEADLVPAEAAGGSLRLCRRGPRRERPGSRDRGAEEAEGSPGPAPVGPLHCRTGARMAWSFVSVRMNRVPSEMAGLAQHISPSEFFLTTSSSFPASKTNVSPSSFRQKTFPS